MRASQTSSVITLVDDESISAPVKARMPLFQIGALCDWIVKVAGLAAAILFGVWAPISYNAAKEGNASNDEAQRLLLEELKIMTQIQFSLVAEIQALNNRMNEMGQEMKDIKVTFSDALSNYTTTSGMLSSHSTSTSWLIPISHVERTTVLPTQVEDNTLVSDHPQVVTSFPRYPQTTTPLLYSESISNPKPQTMVNATSHYQPPWVTEEWLHAFSSNLVVGMTAASLFCFTMHMSAVLLKPHRFKSRGHVQQESKVQAKSKSPCHT